MKLRALRSFRMEDKKRGTMVVREKEETFEIDHSEEGELIYNLLRDLRVTVVDPKFVPVKGQYICLHGFSYENEHGFPRSASPGKEITLEQERASELLVKGFIKPIDDNAWMPVKLFGSFLEEDKIKKMFDDEPLPKESWIRRGMRCKS